MKASALTASSSCKYKQKETSIAISNCFMAPIREIIPST
jgi:hypothetical protein